MAFQAGGKGRLRGDADVGIARGDGGGDRRALAVLEIEVDRGIGREEIRKQPGQVLRQGRGVGQHAHAAFQPTRIGRKLAAHGVDLLQHDAGMVEQAAPGIGQPHAAPAALQQRHVEHLLHAADACAGRRQCKVRALGAVRDAAGLGDVAEQAEIGEVEAHGQAYVRTEGRVHILRIVLTPSAANRPPWLCPTLILVCLVFVLAGFTKGIIGLGLPTIAMGLLAVVLPPAEAAALLILPSLVTNVWQMLDGPHLGRLLRRLWPLNAGVCLGTWLGAALLAGIGGRHGGLALGLALIAYAISGLAALRLVVPRTAEPVLGPITGALTGGITAATGVFVIPAVPYLQAIGLHKDELVQALGLSFTVSTLALAVALAGVDAFAPGLVLPSLLAVVVSLAGMRLGQAVRARLRPQAFRLCFFFGLLVLGAYLALRGLG